MKKQIIKFQIGDLIQAPDDSIGIVLNIVSINYIMYYNIQWIIWGGSQRGQLAQVKAWNYIVGEVEDTYEVLS